KANRQSKPGAFIQVALPDPVVAAIDAAAAVEGKDRESFIRDALESFLLPREREPLMELEDAKTQVDGLFCLLNRFIELDPDGLQQMQQTKFGIYQLCWQTQRRLDDACD